MVTLFERVKEFNSMQTVCSVPIGSRRREKYEAWLIHPCRCSHGVFLLHPVTDFPNTCGNKMSLKLPCFCYIGFNWLLERCAPASISTSPPTHAHTQTHLNICLHMLLCMCILKHVFTELCMSFFLLKDSQNPTTAPYRYVVEKPFPSSQGQWLTVFQG